MIKAILMDFNGVIINDEPIQMQVYRDLLAPEGVEMTEEDYHASLGMDDVTFVRAAFERKGKSVDDAKVGEVTSAKFDKWKEVVAKEMPLFEGIGDVIEKFSREFTLGIVSMSRRREIEHVLEAMDLDRFFATIVSAEDVARCKPDPECYRIGFRRLDSFRTATGHLAMTHNDCLVIEDSPPGVVGARNADLPVLGVANTVSAEALRTAGAGAVAKDLRDWFPESIRRVFV
jgi:beta-phosphoglucomutase-like phosphatase (HAD superfamily)